MKALRSILLGGAAGLIAVAGAQAADLPVKAKPVEYVKVCSLYGEGFFYIPGTDTCLKIGGWVRYDQYFGTGTGGSPFISGGDGRNDSFDSEDYNTRARTVVSFDARTATEYGVLRAYIRGGFQLDTNYTAQGSVYFERAFIQFAGFTFGKSQSYFDFAAQAWSYMNAYVGAGASTISYARSVAAYTANLGNGVSWTIAAEDATSRRGALWDAGTNSLSIGSFPGPNAWAVSSYPGSCGAGSVTADNNIGNTAAPFTVTSSCATGDYAAQSIPDIVASLRVEQAWGSAQIMGATHQVRGNFYGNDTQATISLGPNAFTGIRPSDAWGWAVGAGIVLNLPWNPGDKFWLEGEYGMGTPCYVGFCQDGYDGTYVRFSGNQVMAGWGLDGVFANAVGPAAFGPSVGGATNLSGIILPTVWSIESAVEHYWTQALRTSLFASWSGWDPGAQGNAIMCNSPNAPTRGIAGQSGGAVGVPTTANYGANPVGAGAIAGCNYAWNIWAVGSRTVWNPVRNLDVGVEVMWSQLQQNMDPSKIVFNFGGVANRAAGFYSPSDMGVLSGMVRIQRNFYP